MGEVKREGKTIKEAVGKEFDGLGKSGDTNGQKVKRVFADAARDISKSFQNAGESIKGTSEKIGNFGSVLTDKITKPMMAVFGTGGFIGAMSIGFDEEVARIQANAGWDDYADNTKKVLKDVFNTGLTADLNEASSMIQQVMQQVSVSSDEELSGISTKMLAFKKAFPDADEAETLRGINSLMVNFGLSADEAFDYLAKGTQMGLDKTGELGDNIAEYGQLWSQAGFKADEMFGMLQNGLQSGAYNLDKANDFVKEFTISLSDGRIEENLSSFSAGTQDLFWQFKNGQATANDVFKSLTNDFKGMTNEQDKLSLASTLWSSLGEDNAMKVIESMGGVNDTFSDVGGTMDGVQKKMEESFGVKIQKTLNELRTSFEPLGTTLLNIAMDYLPSISNAIKGFSDKLSAMPKEQIESILKIGGVALIAGPVIKAMSTLGSGFGTLTSGIGMAVGWFGKLSGAISIAGGFFPWLGGLIAAINWPIVLIVGAVGLLIGAFVLAYQKIEPFRNFINGLLEDIKVFATKIYNEYIKPALDSVVQAFQRAFAAIKKFWDENGAAIISAIGNFFKIAWTLIQPALKMWQGIFGSTFKTVVGLVQTSWKTVQGVFSGAFTIIGGLIKVFSGIFTGDMKKVMDGVKDIFKGGWQVIASGIEGFANAALKMITGLGNGMKNGILGAVNGVIGVINKVIEFFGGEGLGTIKLADFEAPTVKLPRFEGGSGGLPQDTLGVVNDQHGSTYKEMIIEPNGNAFIPQGRNVVLPMKKGTQILPAGMTKDMLPHFEKGSFSKLVGNVVDFAKKGWNKVKDFTGDVWDYVSNPGELVKTLFGKMVKLDGLGGKMLDIGGDVVGYLGDKAVDWVQGLFDSHASDFGDGSFYGDDSKSGNGVYQYLMNIANGFIQRYKQYGLYLSSGLRFTDAFDHSKGLAVDLAIPGVNNGSPIYQKIANEAINMDGVKYVITNGMWRHKGQSWVTWPDGDHYDHVHISGNKPSGPKYQAGGSGKVGGSWLSTIYKAAAQMGQRLSAAEATGILAQIQRESGGNEKIIQSSAVWDINMANGNPARGLLQYIPQTFRAYAVKGYGNIMNGYHQLLAFFNNSNWRRDLPYGQSGWGPSGYRINGSHKDGLSYVPFDGYNAVLHKGERVLTADENRSYSNNSTVQALENKFDMMINLLSRIADKDPELVLDARSFNKANAPYQSAQSAKRNKQTERGLATDARL